MLLLQLLADLFREDRGREMSLPPRLTSNSTYQIFEIQDVAVAHFEDPPYVLQNQFVQERYGIHAFGSRLIRSPREALILPFICTIF
jgi:hypothetical protein